MEQSERDPRIDPKPGDVVRDAKRNIVRYVIIREGGDIWYGREGQAGPDRQCWITTWQEWCRRNKVEVCDE